MAKRKNVPAGVKFCNIQGVNCPIRYVPIHKANPAIDMASPRTFVGYISESKTHTTAQIETAQQKIYSRKNVSRKRLETPSALP